MEQFFARIDTELADRIRQRGYTIDQLRESGADDLRKEGFCTRQIDKIHSTLAELGLKPYGAERTSLSRSSVCADG